MISLASGCFVGSRLDWIEVNWRSPFASRCRLINHRFDLQYSIFFFLLFFSFFFTVFRIPFFFSIVAYKVGGSNPKSSLFHFHYSIPLRLSLFVFFSVFFSALFFFLEWHGRKEKKKRHWRVKNHLSNNRQWWTFFSEEHNKIKQAINAIQGEKVNVVIKEVTQHAYREYYQQSDWSRSIWKIKVDFCKALQEGEI